MSVYAWENKEIKKRACPVLCIASQSGLLRYSSTLGCYLFFKIAMIETIKLATSMITEMISYVLMSVTSIPKEVNGAWKYNKSPQIILSYYIDVVKRVFNYFLKWHINPLYKFFIIANSFNSNIWIMVIKNILLFLIHHCLKDIR